MRVGMGTDVVPRVDHPLDRRPQRILVDEATGEKERTLDAPLGERLVSVSSGAKAVALAAKEDFALILLDLQMPELDGLETADEAVNVALVNDDRRVWLSIAGDASIVDDRARVHRLWSPYAQAFFPGGVDKQTVKMLGF